jgi:hypothetical protein
MKKSFSLLSMSLLAASLMMPMGRAYADLDPPGNKRERQELREDVQRLDRLTMQRNRELHQGDFREAREYDEKICDQRREVRRDWRELYIEMMIADGILNADTAFMNLTSFSN